MAGKRKNEYSLPASIRSALAIVFSAAFALFCVFLAVVFYRATYFPRNLRAVLMGLCICMAGISVWLCQKYLD